ncbi:hypothetical protein [Desulfocurvibacter africanus]|uniref:hypothetical protein n=1 Tax=Desulfocurvibacter africanus TaxID=873 RepID=UPI000408F19C|nr:hypothetical protein [Desulfocurvibacter africanus]
MRRPQQGAPEYGTLEGRFTDGDPAGGVPASVFIANMGNHLLEELCSILTAAGIAPDEAKFDQVLQSMRRLMGGNVAATVTATGTLSLDQAGLVRVDATAGDIVLTLPAANALKGATFRIVRVDNTANMVTIQRAGADTIDGVTSITLLGQYARRTIVTDGSSAWLTVSSLAVPPLLHVRDEKPSGTGGGTVTAGAWRTRDLNAIKHAGIAGASLVSNKVTLPAGEYYIEASAPSYEGNSFRIRIRNITDNVTELIGSSEFAGGVDQCRSFLGGRMSVSGQKQFELQQYNSTAGTASGGVPVNMGEVEVFSEMKVWRIS